MVTRRHEGIKLRRMLRFGIVGLLNTTVGITVIFALKALLGVEDVPANAIGYGVGLITSFGLNKRWTYRHRGPLFTAFLRFLLTFAISYTANLVALVLLLKNTGIDSYVCHALGLLVYVALFFGLSTYFVFREAR